MVSKAIEEAFKRHPRPQVPIKPGPSQRLTVPTKVALLQRAIEDDRQRSLTYRELPENPWETLIRQGDLVQGKHVRSICVHQRQLVMVREMAKDTGRRQLEVLKKLSDHPHISTIEQSFETENAIFFQLEYSRYTLEEVLNVHTCLEDLHIRVIASTIFYAIQHIAKIGMIHNAISISTIRFCSSGKPVLADFDNFSFATTEHTANHDLECLGLVVLECMNGAPKKKLRDLEEVRRLRGSNKTFGLDNGEQWSGCKLLVDFLDNLFNFHVPAIAKLQNPHRYVEREPGYGILIPFLELVPLECFALWRAAAAK
ncbi:hypothetical protein AA0121_g9160 [Alternaria tenuissima]|nr:hypothetical protein AA0121_g9160 [Alternaria tenuissima]